MTGARVFRRRMAVLMLATGLLSAVSVVAAIPVAADDPACSSGAHTLSHFGDRVYPEMGNGGYTSVHTDVHMVYDATTNLFLPGNASLPGNHVDLTITTTQCLSDFSFDFERSSADATAGPNMTVNSVTVGGNPATFTFVQPTYPGDPNGQDDPDPLAHQVGNVVPVGGGNTNPPACSPQVSGTSQNGQPCPANKLVITPVAPIPSGQTIVVSIAYTGRPGVHHDGDGTTEGWFRSNSPVGDGAFVTTEPVGTEAWMPLNNHPLAKPTYTFYDTVNVGKVAIANGLLMTTNPPPTNPPDANFPAGSVTWIWNSPEPIASYLVENSVGAFDLTSATEDGIVFYEAQGSSLTPARKATNKAVMDQQPDITRFQSIFNGPFPLTTNGVIVGIPSASFEEEMQGKITFNGGSISLGTFNHENFHQWFGDNVAEAAFNLTFWKEGWATVGQYLQTARNAQTAAGGPGTPAGDAAFDASLVSRFNTNYGTGSSSAWTSAPSNPTVGNLFTTVSTYTRPGTAYLALHQILDSSYSRLASDRWIKAMKQIQSQYGGGNINEAQLEAVFHQWLPNQSAACSTKLDSFFTQWFDTAYPTPNNATNKPQITGPGINGPDHFYNDASPCTRADQAISFGALPNKFFDDPDFSVSASSDSGLAVSFAASGQCTVTGSTVHLLGLGSCTITASQAGDLVFKPAPDVPRTFAITKHPQTITFAPIPTKAYLDADFAISPTASSGLPVALVASGDCTIDSAVAPANVHIVQAGSCTITASQAGDGTYDPAPDVANTFTIDEAQIASLNPVHTWVSLKNGDDVGTSFDVKVDLLKNGSIIETGLLRCVSGVGRNPSGTVIDVPWTLVPATVDKGDILSLKVSTRIGTITETTKCAGHNSATGLRLYYDSAAQASALGATIGSVPVAFTEYLRSNGNVCKNAESTGVSNRYLDPAAPGATPGAKCKDSTTVNFAGGNPYKEIGTWGVLGNWILP